MLPFFKSFIPRGGANDDWVELYNPNEIDVSLDGWSIQKHSPDRPCSIKRGFYKKSFVVFYFKMSICLVESQTSILKFIEI